MTINNFIFNSDKHEYNVTETNIIGNQTLKWNHDLGIGYLNPDLTVDHVYDEHYWNSYRKLIDTEIGKNLTNARIDIAKLFQVKPLRLLDVGIGNGAFVDKFGCYGADINPFAIEYLKKNHKYYNPIEDSFKWQWMSFWDCLEHITDATNILSKCDGALISMPIYQNLEHCLSSKHLKPKEHYWYFTISGLIHYMNYFGFDCKYYSTIESKLGRDSIGSFVFRRFK